MRLLVFGKAGQVATKLQTLSTEQCQIIALGRDDADLSKPSMCVDAIKTIQPDAVINAAAYTAVDAAEDDAAAAQIINADAPTAMSQACAEANIPFVHISTDYVFDGTGSDPRTPDAPTNPLGVYGRSKLDGEQGVQASGGTFAIIRTSWVFSDTGNNFVKTMLRLAETRDQLSVVDDQIGGPTDAATIAASCVKIAQQLIAEPSKAGVYHFAGTPAVSWAEFAQEIFNIAGLSVQVSPIPSSAYPTKAKRPTNSRLDGTTLTQAFGIHPPDWRENLKTVITTLQSAT